MHGVGDQRASKAMQRAVIFRRARGGQHAIFLLKGDALRHGHGELPFRSLHVNPATLQRDVYARGHWNWFVSDT